MPTLIDHRWIRPKPNHINRPINQNHKQVNGAGRHPLYAALFQYEPELSGYPTRIAWVRWRFKSLLWRGDRRRWHWRPKGLHVSLTTIPCTHTHLLKTKRDRTSRR